MAWVVITKRVKDLAVLNDIQSKLSPLYPLECEEFETYEAALLKYPSSIPYTTENYNSECRDYRLQYEQAEREIEAESNATPWWKFWG